MDGVTWRIHPSEKSWHHNWHYKFHTTSCTPSDCWRIITYEIWTIPHWQEDVPFCLPQRVVFSCHTHSKFVMASELIVVRTYTRTHTCTHMHTHARARARARVNIHTHIHTSVLVCVCVCACSPHTLHALWDTKAKTELCACIFVRIQILTIFFGVYLFGQIFLCFLLI